jgi:hypothetical protein
MITCILKGGLGNQLFQIFTTIAYSFRIKNPFMFSYMDTISGETPRPTYWTTLLNCLYKYTNMDGLISNNVLESFHTYRGDHGYTKIPSDIEHNICLDGFFQSYKYFEREYSRIYELLDIDGLKSRTNFHKNVSNTIHLRNSFVVSPGIAHSPTQVVPPCSGNTTFSFDGKPSSENPPSPSFVPHSGLVAITFEDESSSQSIPRTPTSTSPVFFTKSSPDNTFRVANATMSGVRTTISLHFRVGDYANKRCYHPVLPLLYYERALRHISTTHKSSRFHVYVFFEQKDIDYVKNAVEQLQPVIPDAIFELVDEPTDWKQMILMSKCHHHIIANSTFSWWGATFSTSYILNIPPIFSSKIVCYPSIWYGHQLYYINTLDLFPNGWTKISFLESEMDKSYCTCFSKK